MNSPSGPTESTVFENHSNSWFVPQISVPLTSIPIPHCTLGGMIYSLTMWYKRESTHDNKCGIYTREMKIYIDKNLYMNVHGSISE